MESKYKNDESIKNIKVIPYLFDCVTLISDYLEKEKSIVTDMNKTPREYYNPKQIELGLASIRKNGFIDIGLDEEYKDGDIIVAKEGRYILSGSIAISDSEALAIKQRKVERIKIADIENKLNHFRHESLMED